MKRIRLYVILTIFTVLLIFMIKNSTALSACIYDGIKMCIRVVIPSLFPFFVMCTYLNAVITKCDIRFLRPVGKLCRIPPGTESILLIGLLGGYPVGAQCVAQSFERKVLSRDEAERMLGFCNNAGPAFIFGMLSSQFPAKYQLWTLWSVQIISSILTACILPGGNTSRANGKIHFENITLKLAVERSVKAIVSVCCWVIIFKVIVSAVLSVLHDIPQWLTILISGSVELVNGCTALSTLKTTGLSFTFASAMLSFGGICVHMQTGSVAKDLKRHLYIKGKLLQTAISIILSIIVQPFIFPLENSKRFPRMSLSICIIVAILIAITFFRKSSRFSAPSVIQ